MNDKSNQTKWNSFKKPENASDSKPIDQGNAIDSALYSKPIQEDLPESPTKEVKSDKSTSNKSKAKIVKVTAGSLNVRDNASKEKGDVIFRVPLNTPLTVLSEEGKWLKVSDPEGREGYVLEEFTKAQ